MDYELQQLRQDFILLKRELDTLKNDLRSQTHNGYDGGLIKLENLLGMFRTISDSTEFTRTTTVADRVPNAFGEQLFIYNNAGTYKLYVYDSVGKVWKNVTIA